MYLRAAIVVSLISIFWNSMVLADSINVIPIPQHVKNGRGEFVFKETTPILAQANSVDALSAARFLADRLSDATGASFIVNSTSDSASGVVQVGAVLVTTMNADISLGDEGYAIKIEPGEVLISAPHAAGLFYGVQTLLQLMPAGVYGSKTMSNATWVIPSVEILDQPRFRWRGLMLDVSRHFEPKAVVMKLLDQMAIHKLNVFHWHLTDDQGWRIEIKKYPKLTSVGAWRDRSGFNMDPSLSNCFDDQGHYGGFYTQDEIREVVAYASARHIMVVPEIEMPGHATAALAAYPELALAGRPFVVEDRPGIFNPVYDPSNEQTFIFLQDILTEVMSLFPSPYIHIGGDEVLKGAWESEPRTVALMKREHLKNADELQSYFVTRIGAFLSSHGRRLIGWDEILEGHLAPDSTVMSWRGTKGGLAAASAGHDVVMSPTSYCYLDFEQGLDTEPHERGALLTVQKAYSYEPIPEGLPVNNTGHILGVQGNLWTEYVPNAPWVEYMVWPRASALAEVGWSSPVGRSWGDFAKRLKVDEQRLDVMGSSYRPLETTDLIRAIHLDPNGKVMIDNPVSGAVIHYTADNTFPTEQSAVYTAPFDLPVGWVHVKARYFCRGKVATPVAAATFLDGRAVEVTSTMQNAWDTRRVCFFTPAWGIGSGETITVTFTAGAQEIKQIVVQSGDGSVTESALKHGELEYSLDGAKFEGAVPFDANGTAHLDVGSKSIVCFRIHLIDSQILKPVIRCMQLQ